MRNSTCIICAQEFEPREGKMYCSNACKQRGHLDKKQQIGAKTEKEQEQKAAKERLEFYWSDYQEYRKKHPDSLDVFLTFCFFRKNFKGVFDAEQFYTYMQTFGRYWWEEFWEDENNPAQKKYKEFIAKYFGDEVAITFSDKSIAE